MNAGYEAESDEAWKYWVKNGLYLELKNQLKDDEDIDRFLEKVRVSLPENAHGSIDGLRKLVRKVDTNTKKDDRLLAKARVIADNFPPHIDMLGKIFPHVNAVQFRRASRSSIPAAPSVPLEPALHENTTEKSISATLERIPQAQQSVPNIHRARASLETTQHLVSLPGRDISHSPKSSTLGTPGFLGRIGYFGAAIGAVFAAPFAVVGGFVFGYLYALNTAYDKFIKPFFEGGKKDGHAKKKDKKEKKHDDHHSGHDHGGGSHGHH